MIKLILEGHSWSLPYHIEARFRYIISEQEAYGWKIDVELMDRLLVELDERRGSIRGEALELIPLRVIDQGEVKKVFKKDGDMTAHVEKWYNNLECRMFRLTDVVGCFSRVDFQVTNLESPIQRITALEKQGWKPTEWNYKTDAHNKPIYDEKGNKIKTSPKLTQDSVEECEVGKLMIEYLTVSHRFKLVSGLRDRLREDNRIGSGGITVGCNTGRMMHRNIVNIPRVGELYGEQVRSLFSSEEGHILVGADLKSLENRLIGHFTHPFDNGEYAKRLEEEDSHDTTVKLVAPYMSITRNMAKTCVPLDTQILTRRGWKLYNEVIIGEDVLAYDPETKTKKWTPLLDTTVLEDEVLEYRDKCRTFRATANHKWFVTQRSRAKNSFKRPYRTHQLRTTKDLTCDSSLITNAPMAEDQDLVSKCSRGLTYKKYNFNWVERVLQMSQTERSRFLEGFLIADGYESSNSWQFSQKTGELQEAALLCSYLVHHSTIRTNDRLCPNGN
ncbi:MAG: hypothetical protein KAS32_05210, partial [Candidatus Peribacteraceae bacterium]|nr:hypothetical protein [Candidatus Peribacteraceae bacterium]